MINDKCLVVDDEPNIRETLRGVLEDENFAVETAATGESALDLVKSESFAVILLDIWLGRGIDGLETLRRLREVGTDAKIVMISGHGNIETAVQATKLGAFDFLEKPLSSEKTVITVRNAVRARELERRNDELNEQLRRDYEMVGDSIAMRALRKQIQIVAPTEARVLISGESGTGKELVARALHYNSRRRNQAFVEVNSAAIAEELVESELFGHTKGAFTGAGAAKKGKFELADNGTLFLDEIGDMSPRVQAKMLRALEEQRFEAVGGTTAIQVDARVISATNQNLDELIESRQFRLDLFYRLSVIPFEVPPLRERLEDVPPLIEHFNRKFARAYNKKPKTFAAEAVERLQNYDFPGNIRELRNIIERVIIMNQAETINADDLPNFVHAPETLSSRAFRFPNFKDAMDAYQREFILHKLHEAKGNVARAAELMNIDRSHLYRRMKSLGINF